jgi:hypothetical protein
VDTLVWDSSKFVAVPQRKHFTLPSVARADRAELETRSRSLFVYVVLAVALGILRQSRVMVGVSMSVTMPAFVVHAGAALARAVSMGITQKIH